jgi:hypothetical protein
MTSTVLFLAGLGASFAAAEEVSPPADPRFVEFADAVEESIRAGDPTVVDRAVDFHAMLRKAVGGSESQRAKQFIETQLEMGDAASFGRQIIRSGARNYRLLRIRGLRALFRMIGDNEAVNYHDFHLTLTSEREVRIVDVEIYIAGQSMSEILRQGYEIGIEADKLQRLNPRSAEYAAMQKDIQILRRLFNPSPNPDRRLLLDLYQQMSPKGKTNKAMLTYALAAAIELDDPAYQQIFKVIETTYPEDGAWDLIRIGPLADKGRFDESLAAVDRLDQKLEGDPYLDYVRAVCLYRKGDKEKSQQFAHSAIRREPTMFNAHRFLIEWALEEKRFDDVARLLEEMEEKMQRPASELLILAHFDDFRRSPEYASWQSKRSRRANASSSD